MTMILKAIFAGLFWLFILTFLVTTITVSIKRNYYPSKLSDILYIIVIVFSVFVGILVYLYGE